MKKVASKKQMQNVNFHSLEDFFEFIPAEERKIVEALRKIIFECVPDCVEKLSYNVPFYKRHFNICFIWPPSIMWGSTLQRGVRFGFTNGYLLHDEFGYLDKGNRKQVYWKDFNSVREIDSGLIESLLHEAVSIDQEKSKNKTASRQKNSRPISKRKKIKH
jgi:hypothetical protein